MGIFIQLFIKPSLIEPLAWAQFYDDAYLLLRSHPDGLMSRRSKKAPGGTRHYYSRDLEFEPENDRLRHLMICGDQTSHRFAERFYLFRDLGRYQTQTQKEVPKDILELLLDPKDGVTTVFDAKTQGYPYHFPLLAVAMLAEDYFPLGAHASGDIELAQAEEARTWAQEVLGRPLALPVSVNSPMLWQRLTQILTPEAAAEAFSKLYRGDSEDSLGVLIPLLGVVEARRWLCHYLGEYTSPDQFGVVKSFVHWLNSTGDLVQLLEVACLAPEGPRWPPEPVIRTVAATWTTLEPASLAFFQPLQRPVGQPAGVWGQMLGVLLDMGGIGRHIRRHIPLDEAAAIVRRVFPREADVLEALLREESAQRSKVLEKLNTPLTRRIEAAKESAAEHDPERLLTCTSVMDLPEKKQQHLRLLTFRMMEVEQQSAKEPRYAKLLEGSPDVLRSFVLYLLEERFVLTEAAWRQIDEETDLGVLRFLASVGVLQFNELRFPEFRTGVLENAELRRSLVRLMEDPVIYEATARELAEARKEMEGNTVTPQG